MNEETQKAFEDWLASESDFYNVYERIMRGKDGSYIDAGTSIMWISWQASREAMKPIKLPTKMKNTQEQSCYYYNDAIDECKEAIQQAGYKVEE